MLNNQLTKIAEVADNISTDRVCQIVVPILSSILFGAWIDMLPLSMTTTQSGRFPCDDHDNTFSK